MLTPDLHLKLETRSIFWLCPPRSSSTTSLPGCCVSELPTCSFLPSFVLLVWFPSRQGRGHCGLPYFRGWHDQHNYVPRPFARTLGHGISGSLPPYLTKKLALLVVPRGLSWGIGRSSLNKWVSFIYQTSTCQLSSAKFWTLYCPSIALILPSH